MSPQVSIIMPVRDEQPRVGPAMQRLARDFPDCELIVVDGGSHDGSLAAAQDIARRLHARVLVTASTPGRARQMNHGARCASGDVLWFVHVDTVIDPAALGQLHDALRDPQTVGGGLTLRFDLRTAGLRYLAHSSNLRARRLHWIFGDQAMFLRREVFQTVGGFPDLPIMEDLELSRRVSRLGHLALLTATSTASARRFDRDGTWRMLVFMQWLKALYFAGVDPADIARRYAAGPRGRRPARSCRPTLKELSRAPDH